MRHKAAILRWRQIMLLLAYRGFRRPSHKVTRPIIHQDTPAVSGGVSRSAVSREAAEAGARLLKELLDRRWDEVDILMIYLDGMQFGSHHVISAVGVDRQGRKHVLDIQLGATENAAAVKDLLVRLRKQGFEPHEEACVAVCAGARRSKLEPRAVGRAVGDV